MTRLSHERDLYAFGDLWVAWNLPARHPFSSGSWLLTACAHARGTLVPIPPGDENAHIVRKPNQTTKWRRYDRARDMFVDMPSRGLEDWHQWPT